DNSNYFFWTTPYLDYGHYSIYSTEDFENINHTFWDAETYFNDGWMITMGGVSFNGTDYVGITGTFPFDNGEWAWPAYVKSTDNGATWSDWNICDFTQIPVLADYDCLFDNYTPASELGIYVSYSCDIQVDKNGRVHMVVGLSDTAETWEATTKNAIVELYEDPAAPTGWDAKIILEGGLEAVDWDWMQELAGLYSPNIGQQGISCYLAFDVDREILVTQWVNTGGVVGDTLATMDIFYSYRLLDGEWAAPTNLTNTPVINESGSHLAPTLKKEAVTGGYDVTFYSMYWYEVGNTTAIIDQMQPCEIFVAPITQFVPFVGVEEEGIKLNSFSLDQNYPNPFNPSTVVNYTLAERSNVTLKVYDVLGKEVANLVNNTQEAGTHQVTFDASNLASGLYIYTLNAGDFTSSKKMMFLK
ncbi:MAG: T9SS type A sorting domain-containing protein, partial [Ignavibacteriaceae bacterium]|nr:T9SS type A sorting domain-containing protein [Ignavibacteriaceae bacterium]